MLAIIHKLCSNRLLRLPTTGKPASPPVVSDAFKFIMRHQRRDNHTRRQELFVAVVSHSRAVGVCAKVSEKDWRFLEICLGLQK
jgi:hypothetical protein